MEQVKVSEKITFLVQIGDVFFTLIVPAKFFNLAFLEEEQTTGITSF